MQRPLELVDKGILTALPVFHYDGVYIEFFQRSGQAFDFGPQGNPSGYLQSLDYRPVIIFTSINVYRAHLFGTRVLAWQPGC